MISVMTEAGTRAAQTALKAFSNLLTRHPQFITDHQSPAAALKLATKLSAGFAISPVVGQEQEEASLSEVQLLCRALEYTPAKYFSEEEQGHILSTLFLLRRDNQHLLFTNC